MSEASSKARVLIVDDESAIRLMLEEYLREFDYAVHSAASGSEALERLDEENFDCLIVDMRLPDMSGESLALLAYAKQPNARTLIHTGSINFKLSPELKAIGLNSRSIIHKPVFDMQDFVSAIEGAVSGNAPFDEKSTKAPNPWS